MKQEKLDMLQEAWLKGISILPVTARGPSGKELRGIRWRYQVERPGNPGQQETTPWVFAPLPEFEQMLRRQQQLLALVRSDPGTSTAQ